MGNYIIINNTIRNTIDFINNIDLVPNSKICLDRNTDINELDRIYKIVDPKTICFNMFKIQEILNNVDLTNVKYKAVLFRTIIAKIVIKSILREFIIDTNYYKSEKSINKICDIYTIKILANNFHEVKEIIGHIDIYNETDCILKRTKIHTKVINARPYGLAFFYLF